MNPKRIIAIITLACLASALAIFMVSINVSADTGDGDPDLSFIEPTDGTLDVDPGDGAEFTIRVTNDGIGTDKFYLNLTYDYSKDWDVDPTQNQSLGEIPVDQYKDFIITITPNDDPAVNEGEFLRVTVMVFNKDEQDDIDKTDTAYPKATCNQIYEVTAEVLGDDEKQVETGETASFNLNVTNRGNGEDTFIFSISDQTPLETDWTASLPSPVRLARNANTTETVKLKAPNNAKSGEHWYNIRIESSGDGNEFAGVALTIDVGEDYDFTVKAKDDVTQELVDPGNTADFSAIFNNSGNDEDQYDLEVNESDKPDDWSYTLNEANTQKVQPGGSLTLSNFLSVTPSDDYENAAANSFWLTKVNATSRTNSSVKRVVVFKTKVNQVYDIEVSANESSKWVEEAGTVYYEFTITNNGNGEDSISVQITGDKADWGDLNTPATVVLKRKGSGENIAYANVSVSVPDGTEESSTGYRLNLTVTSENEIEKSNARVSIKVQQNFEVSAVVDGATLKYINEEESGIFTINFTNKGNGEDTIKITTGGDEPGWASIVGKIILGPSESKDVILTVAVPKDQELGTYNITVIGTSDEDDTPPIANASVSVTIKVNQTYDVSLSFPKNSQKVDPDNFTVFDFTVTNDGTGQDKIILDTDSIPSGWAREFSQREIWLNASETTNMKLTIEVHEDAPREDFYINVTATSFGNSTIYAITEISVSVNQSYKISLDKEPPTRIADPGDTVQFKITINNEGTGEDRIDVDVEEKPNYWTVDDLAAITVEKDSSVVRYINITIPDNATKDNYVINLKGTSLEDPNQMTYSINLDVSVREFYNFTIAIVGTTKSIDPGNKVNFTFTITNKGNHADTYSFDEEGLLGQWEPSYVPSGVSIQPGAKKNITLSVYIPLEETQRTENIKIIITSDGDKLLNRTFTINIIVNQTYDLDISADPAVKNIKPENNAFVEYNITINNTGTGTDSFTLELSPDVPSGWSYSLAANTGDIQADKEVTKVLKINIPDKYDPGNYYFNVSATSDRRGSVSKKTPILVKVLEIYKFDLTIDKDTLGVYPDEYVIFEFKVKNTGTAKDKIYFARSAIPTGWQAPYPSYVEINVSEEKTVQLNVSVDKDQTAMDYKIWFNGTSDEEKTFTRSEDITVHVKQRYEVQLSIGKDTEEARPKEIVKFNFELTNTGTGVDDFTFLCTTPEGWNSEKPTRQNGVDVDETRILQLNITIPDDEPPKIYGINLTVRSEKSKVGDEYKVTTSLKLYIDLKQKYEVQVTPEETTINLYPGTEGWINITVQNKGTGFDNYTISLKGENRTEGKITYPKSKTLFLAKKGDPNDTGYVNISFEADELEPKWVWEIIAEVKSTDEDYEGEVIDNCTIHVDIQSYYNVTYVIDALSKKARPGQETVGTVQYKINAKNKGTGEDTLTMKILQTQGTKWPWASWPSGTPSDIVAPNSIGPEHTLKVDVPAGTRKGIYKIEVRVKSSKDSTKWEIIPIEVDVQRYTKFDIVFIQPLIKKPNPGENASFKVKIINKGNSIENFTLDTIAGYNDPPEFESKSYYPEAQEVMLYPTILRPEEFKYIYLNVSTDSEADPGNYVIPLIVYSTTNLSDMGGVLSKVEKKYGNFTVDIQARYSISLTGITSNYDANPGGIVNVTLKIKNTGTEEDVVSFGYNVTKGIPERWKITNPDIIDPLLAEEGSNSRDVYWLINIKDKEEKKEFYIHLTAKNEFGTPGDPLDDMIVEFNVTINVLQLFDVEVKEYKNITLYPNSTEQIIISIKNTGTGLDKYDLSLEKGDTDKGKLTPDTLLLDRNEEGYAYINVSAGPKVTDDSWNFTFQTKSAWSYDNVTYNVTKITEINVDIQPYYEVTYSVDSIKKKAWPRRTTSYDVTFAISAINRGTGEDTIEMEVIDGEYSDWADWATGKPSITLPQDETSDPFELIVTVPMQTLKTTADRKYIIQVLVKSTENTSVTDIIELEIDVQRYTLFDVTFTAPKRVDNNPGDTYQFSIKITNKGNSVENFTVEEHEGYSKPDGIKEISYDPGDAEIMLMPDGYDGSSNWIYVNVTSDPEASPDVANVNLSVYSKDNYTDNDGDWSIVIRNNDTFVMDIQASHSFTLDARNIALENINPDAYENVTCQIENTGTDEDEYSFSYVTIDLPEGWAIENPDPITLQSGDRRNVTWIVHIKKKEKVGSFYINFTAKAKNGTVTDPNDDETKQIDIKFIIQQLFDLKVDTEISPNLDPGVLRYLNFTIENTGTGDDTYTIAIKGDTDFVTMISEDSVTLQKTQTFNITVEIDAPEEPTQKDWYITIYTNSTISWDEVGYRVDRLSYLNITMKDYFKPTLVGTTYDNADTDGYVTTYHSFHLRLRNDGTEVDTLNMSIIDTESPLGAHWNGVPPDGVQLDPYPPAISDDYELEIEIPKLTPFKKYNITLWIHSAMGKGKKADLQLEINKYFEVSISIVGPESKPVYLNETLPKAEFTVNITNKGNTNMDLKLIYNGGLPNAKWTTDPGGEGRDFLDMGSKEYKLETIKIEPDDEAKEEIYSNIRFRLFPTEDELTYEEVSLSVEVKEYRDISLKKVGGSYNVKPSSGNEKVAIPFDIINDGNVDDTVRLEILNSFYETYPNATRWEVNFYSNNELNTKITSKDVTANSDETVYLGIIIPTSVDERSYVPADLSPYIIPIYGESSKEETVNSQADLSLIIDSLNEVYLEYNGGTKKADAGDTISFEIKVENYGNAADTMIFDTVDENDWVHPLDEKYKERFEAGEKRTIRVNLTVPTIAEDDNAEAGNYDIELRAKPTTGGTQRKINLPFKIKETYGCELDIIDVYKKETMPEFGTEIKFKFKVTNLGNSKTDNSIRIPAIDAIYNLSSSDFNKWDVRFQEGGGASKDELTLYIDPLDSEEVSLVIDTRPYGGFQDYYGVEIRSYPLGHLEDEADPQKVWLNCTEPEYELKWASVSRNQSKTVEPEEGTKIEYTCYLENTGTEDDIVTIRLEPLDADIRDWKVKFKTAEGEEETVSYEITHGDKETVTVVVYPAEDADYDPLPYNIEIVAESELETTATDRLILQTSIKRPDLVILARDITVPDDVKEGDLAQITVKISNEGNAKARDVRVQFFSDIDMSDELDSKTITIPANSSASVNGDWDVEAGKYHITVYVDKKNEIREINEENNRATSPVTTDVRQDLVVSSIEIDVDAVKGETVTVVVTVWNNGSADVRNIKCTLYMGSEKIADATITSISAGSSEIAEFDWKIPDEKDKKSYNLKAEVPTTYLGQDDPTPGDNKERKTVPVEDAPSLVGGNMMMFALIGVIGFLVLIVVVVLVKKPKAAAPPGKMPAKKGAMKGKPPKEKAKGKRPGKPGAPPGKPGVVAAGTVPKKGAPPGKPGAKTIKCPKCKSPIVVESAKRPIKIECKKCGAKGTLKK